jgi:hypothetical protein
MAFRLDSQSFHRNLLQDLSIPSGKTVKDVLDGARRYLDSQGVATVDLTEAVEEQQDVEDAAIETSSQNAYLPIRKFFS